MFCDLKTIILLRYFIKVKICFFNFKKSPNKKKKIIIIKINCLKLIFRIYYITIKAYSSEVERTAHNGLVVGSNPTKPIKMQLSNKKYKILKTKRTIKTNNIIYICNGSISILLKWIAIEQKLKKNNLNYYKIFNKLTLNILKKSVFNKSHALINGNIFLLVPLKPKKILNHVNKELFNLIAIKLNKKIYKTNTLTNIDNTNYINNKLLFYQFNITLLKFFCK